MAAVLALLLMSSVLELRGLGEGRGPLLCNFSEEAVFWRFFVGPYFSTFRIAASS